MLDLNICSHTPRKQCLKDRVTIFARQCDYHVLEISSSITETLSSV